MRDKALVLLKIISLVDGTETAMAPLKMTWKLVTGDDKAAEQGERPLGRKNPVAHATRTVGCLSGHAEVVNGRGRRAGNQETSTLRKATWNSSRNVPRMKPGP